MKSNKSNKPNQDTIMRAKATYGDIYQKRPGYLKILETFVFVIAMLPLGIWVPGNSTLFMALALLSAAIIIGCAPFVYRKWLSPEYVLTKTQLIVRIKGQERSFSLSDIERTSKWRPIFRLQGKKESIMASNDFIRRLEEQMTRLKQKKKKRL